MVWLISQVLRFIIKKTLTLSWFISSGVAKRVDLILRFLRESSKLGFGPENFFSFILIASFFQKQYKLKGNFDLIGSNG